MSNAATTTTHTYRYTCDPEPEYVTATTPEEAREDAEAEDDAPVYP